MSNATGTARPSSVRAGRNSPAKNLVFAAKRLASVHIAIGTAKTWGTFCRKMPAEDLRYVVDRLRERQEPLPRKRDKFGFGLLPPAYFDGDWPGWPEQMMLNWMPGEIVEKYGRSRGSVFNGDYLVLQMSDAEEILKALERDGFKCRLDEKLVRQACGRSSSAKTAL